MTNLAPRLEDLPGVASVVVDLDDPEDSGIRVRLEPGADEESVMERVRALLVAYGVRPTRRQARVGQADTLVPNVDLGVEVRVTPVRGKARVEVLGEKVRSFRVVPATPLAIAQGISDAWCQVAGKIPMEVIRTRIDGSILHVAASDGRTESVGLADTSGGLELALAHAVGRALGIVPSPDLVGEKRQTSLSW